MLARLEAIDGVTRAEVDGGGHLIRVSARDERSLGASITLLNELGHRATPTPSTGEHAWYDARSVGELSRIEAGIIADRIVPAFAQREGLSPDRSSQLHAAVVDALHHSFVTNTLEGEGGGGAFRRACVMAVRDGAGSIIGVDQARALGRSLDADLGGGSG